MSKLSFKLREQAVMKGKPRVWFCAHPSDHKKYLDLAADMLLAACDCAVFYDEEPAAPYDAPALFRALGEMDLFLIPVTAAFLAGDCRAVETELAFAEEHGIPVLPVMWEEICMETYRRVCGDRPLLDPYAVGRVGDAPDRKLRAYLHEALARERVTGTVREAFDACMALGCHSDDLSYAHELMRAIHANEFCRDIAIPCNSELSFLEIVDWELLKKSKLLVLTVTPRLLGEEKGTLSELYAAATEIGLPILAVSFEDTAREVLEAQYPGIPECIPAEDGAALTAALLNILGELDLPENDDDPEHNYRIGLAYLYGADVERDPARALSLITAAAEAEHLEAMETLAFMHRAGLGAPCNAERAREAQETLVCYYRTVCEYSEDEEDAQKFTELLGEYGDALLCDGNAMAAMEIFGELLGFCEGVREKFGAPFVKKGISDAYTGLGKVHQMTEELGEAAESYRAALATDMERTMENKDTESFCELAASYLSLGSAEAACDAFDRAKECFEKAQMLLEHMEPAAGLPDTRLSLALACARLADVYAATGHHEKALRQHQRERSIMESEVVTKNTERAFCGLARVYDKIGNTHQQLGALGEAGTYYERALTVRKELIRKNASVVIVKDLLCSYERIAELKKALGDLAGAEETIALAHAAAGNLIGTEEDVTGRRALSLCCERLGEICM